MIDLETMGLPPAGAIVSIGACMFDLDRCEIGPKFKRNINLATAVRDGGVIDAGTVCWWLTQGDDARKSILIDNYDIRQVLTEFGEWIAQHSSVKDVRVWGNGAAFDLTVLNSAYRRSDIRTPWSFSRERCFRTVRNMYPAVVYDPEQKGDGAHDALTDAIFQAEHLFAIKQRRAA
jgi:exodeoxyribonuclease VIII